MGSGYLAVKSSRLLRCKGSCPFFPIGHINSCFSCHIETTHTELFCLLLMQKNKMVKRSVVFFWHVLAAS